MQNSVCQTCGGCSFRSMGEAACREEKFKNFKQIMSLIKAENLEFDEPVFIKDGRRRRADMEFCYQENKLVLGFYEAKTHNLINIPSCPMLCPELNAFLPSLHRFLNEFCQIKTTLKYKKKLEKVSIKNGSVQLLNADNGIDVLLNLNMEPALEHRLSAADFLNAEPNLLRISWSIKGSMPETVAVKTAPELYLGTNAVEIPAGVFLQVSKDAETAMIQCVKNYLGTTEGRIADLFCGLGTFTFPLSQNPKNEIIAADSSASSLMGMKKALNRNQIKNVTVIERNLFKYPFDAMDLKGVNAVVIDPPRAGAHEQCRQIALFKENGHPQKIIFVSCNPKTFVPDAQILIKAGYDFERVTMVDQFVYSKHQELIALFTYNPENKKEHDK